MIKNINDPDFKTACKCVECYCKEFSQKQTSQHGKNCKCSICICDPCNDTETLPDMKDDECHCSTCQCEECVKKSAGDKADAAEAKTEPPIDTSQALICKCMPCKCITCSIIPELPKDLTCFCTHCKCIDCKVTRTNKDKLQTGLLDPPPFKVPERIECQCDACTCIVHNDKVGPAQAGDQDDAPPLFEIPKRLSCTCEVCACVNCNKETGKGDPTAQGNLANQNTVTFQLPQRMPCNCQVCTCVNCYKAATQGGTAGASRKVPIFEVPQRISCTCKVCTCINCDKKGSADQGEPDMGFQVPQRIACTCPVCTCVICDKGKGRNQAGGRPGDQKFQALQQGPCNCQACACLSCNTGNSSIENRPRGGSTVNRSKYIPRYTKQLQCVIGKTDGRTATITHGNILEIPVPILIPCNCKSKSMHFPETSIPSIPFVRIPSPRARSAPAGNSRDTGACTADTCPSNCLSLMNKSSTFIHANRNTVGIKIGDSVGVNTEIIRIQKNLQTTQPQTVSISANFNMSDSNQMSSFSKRRCGCSLCAIEHCIDGLSADNLSHEKGTCRCKDQIKEIQSVIKNIKTAYTSVEKKFGKNALVKQESVFSQTLSGLKLAFTSLQEKCKNNEKVIGIVNDEFKDCTSSYSMLNVLQTVKDSSIYNDAATYIYPADKQQMTKIIETEACAKKKGTCNKCGKIHKYKHKNIDLTNFEVTDIRRITRDSILLSWRPPKNESVIGYDIFIDGTRYLKVIGGSKMSAMIHAIDLSKTIQLSVYAVTKCGRCEPPAVAIYAL